MNIEKAYIGISQCLTNSIVRYDEIKQFNSKLIDELSKHFTLLAICPEVESGLSVPRPPIELVKIEDSIRVLGRDNKLIDVTDSLTDYSNKKVLSISHLSGYIFKARSPSCGVATTPIFNQEGAVKYYSNGVFADALLAQYPGMPVVDDSNIFKKEILESFIDDVNSYNSMK